MGRGSCGVKLVDKTNNLLQTLDMNETIDQSAIANGVCWHGHALKKDTSNFLCRALCFDMDGTGKRGNQRKPG